MPTELVARQLKHLMSERVRKKSQDHGDMFTFHFGDFGECDLGEYSDKGIFYACLHRKNLTRITGDTTALRLVIIPPD